MTDEKEKSGYKTFIICLVGFFVLIVGITLSLMWWDDVIRLIRGILGIVLAMGGLLVLYTLNKK